MKNYSCLRLIASAWFFHNRRFNASQKGQGRGGTIRSCIITSSVVNPIKIRWELLSKKICLFNSLSLFISRDSFETRLVTHEAYKRLTVAKGFFIWKSIKTYVPCWCCNITAGDAERTRRVFLFIVTQGPSGWIMLSTVGWRRESFNDSHNYKLPMFIVFQKTSYSDRNIYSFSSDDDIKKALKHSVATYFRSLTHHGYKFGYFTQISVQIHTSLCIKFPLKSIIGGKISSLFCANRDGKFNTFPSNSLIF